MEIAEIETNNMTEREQFQKIVWKAVCEMGDYFSRLGGAGRPWEFTESDIPSYIICDLLRKYDCVFSCDSYVNSDLLYPKQDDIKCLIEKVNGILSEIRIDESSINLINEFWNFCNDKLKIGDKSNNWDKLKKRIESYNYE